VAKASDRPLDAFLAAVRGAIHNPGSNSTSPQKQREPPDCLLHLHVAVTNLLHKPLKSLARCFRSSTKRLAKQPTPLRDQGPSQQLDLLLCIAFDAFAHNLQWLEGACRQKGAEFGIAIQRRDQFELLRKVIDGKRADFDGFLSSLAFAKVGAPSPPSGGIMGASPAPVPAPVSDHEDNSEIGNREGTDSGSDAPQQPQRLAARLLDVPLSNVERLRSTLLAVSLAELIELVPQLVGRSSTPADGHPNKKKLFSVQDFFRYAEVEGMTH
jgi:hypothetical protein